MPVLRNIRTLVTCEDKGTQSELSKIDNAAIAWKNDTIAWLGPDSDLPEEYQQDESIDAGGCVVTPGLIDCHTHLAFGGWRADEFEMRMLGKSYLEIAKAGGGILSTVKDTREASEAELLEKCKEHLEEIAKLGVTTIECKSGYGLNLEDELKILRVYKTLQEHTPLTIISTFLGAHTVPKEFKEKREEYLSLVVDEMIPIIAEKKLASFCDVFLEDSAFSYNEAEAVLKAGVAHGLTPKIHADQLSDGNGAELAASLSAASADHLECISEKGINALKGSNTVAVTLPLASLYTHQAALNARPLIENNIPVAVATDFNPGSAPSYHLPLAMMLACTMNCMTPAEALKGATIYAAKAVLKDSEIGSLEVGKKADIIGFKTPSVNHMLYNFTANRCNLMIKNGDVNSI